MWVSKCVGMDRWAWIVSSTNEVNILQLILSLFKPLALIFINLLFFLVSSIVKNYLVFSCRISKRLGFANCIPTV